MSKMYDNITGRSPIATDDLGYIGTGNKASDILSGGGTTDYNDLNNKPTINNVELKGNKSASDLGLQPTIDSTHKLSPDNISFTESQSNSVNSGITADDVEQIDTNKNNILSLNTDTALLKNTITTIRFSQGVTRTITFPRPNYNMFIVFGFVQGVGLVNWDCRSSNDGVLSVRDVLTASSVTQDTITYTRDLDAGTATVTISSNVNQWSYLTIIKNADIT